MLIFDAHLDLSMNALEWNRDLTRPISEVRRREVGRTDKVDRGSGTVTLPEMRRGKVGLCVATLIARAVEPGNPLPGWHSPQIAWAQTQAQLAWYRAMEEAAARRRRAHTAPRDHRPNRQTPTRDVRMNVRYFRTANGAITAHRSAWPIATLTWARGAAITGRQLIDPRGERLLLDHRDTREKVEVWADSRNVP